MNAVTNISPAIQAQYAADAASTGAALTLIIVAIFVYGIYLAVKAAVDMRRDNAG